MLVTKQLTVAMNFYNIFFFFHTIEVNGYRQLLVIKIVYISSVVLNRRKKLIRVWNNLMANKAQSHYPYTYPYPSVLRVHMKV